MRGDGFDVDVGEERSWGDWRWKRGVIGERKDEGPKCRDWGFSGRFWAVESERNGADGMERCSLEEEYVDCQEFALAKERGRGVERGSGSVGFWLKLRAEQGMQGAPEVTCGAIGEDHIAVEETRNAVEGCNTVEGRNVVDEGCDPVDGDKRVEGG